MMARPVSETRRYARNLGLTLKQLRHLGGMQRVNAMSEETRTLMISLSKQDSLRHKLRHEDGIMKLKDLEENCPEDYNVVTPGHNIDMLGKTELWRIFEHHPNPFLTRIPQDLIDTPFGPCAQRIPEEWGRCLYYKTV